MAAVMIILALAFVFAAPVVGASAPGAVGLCTAEGVCTAPQIRFTQSLDCYLLGAGPGQWIGVYYFEGGVGVGCGPVVV
jgi:hypothetical protein